MTERAFETVADDPRLPRVLLIGDSISIGYTLAVRRLLQGKANVHRPPDNCQYTAYGLDQLDGWLGTGKWDVIHFNFGLHDLKYVGTDGKNTSPETGKQVAPLATYEANLRQIVLRLQKTGAKLIWCSTTQVPEGAEWRIAHSEVAYNETAARMMGENAVAVDDLWAAAAKNLARIQLPRNVHFTDDGYAELARIVAASMERALP